MNWTDPASARFLAAPVARKRTLVSACGFVVVSLGLATGLRWLLAPVLGTEVPFILYLPGIMATAAWCGFRVGMTLAGLSALVAWYCWLAPALTWMKPEPYAWLNLFFWLLISLFVVGTLAVVQGLVAREVESAAEFEEHAQRLEAEIARRREAERKLAEHNELLERVVAERTKVLEETVTELEAFSYTVSHDLRSPARAMQGFAELLLTEYGDRLDAQGRDYLQRIDRGAQRMDLLIKDVLAFSRVGRAAMEIKRVDLEELITDAVFQNSPVKKNDAEIRIERPLTPVMGSPAALSQAVAELLNNAAKFVAPGVKPHIRIWTEPRDSRVLLSVQDNGVGIPEPALPNLFKPFHRAHPDANYEGTGMGLAIVKRAVERQGGSVTVRSKPGEGSTFQLELPAAPCHPLEAAA